MDENLTPSLQNLLFNSCITIPIGKLPLDELEITWKQYEDFQQLKYILHDILGYPSADMADLHRDCNRLGSLDITTNKGEISKKLLSNEYHQINCTCCGFLLQHQQIPLETSLKNISNLGVSTHLYFRTFINLIYMLSLLLVVYVVFSIATNVIAHNNFTQRLQSSKRINFLSISLSAKQLNQTFENQRYYYIQCWLGLVTVIIWCVLFTIFKYLDEKDQGVVDNKTVSAADFSIVIQGVPTNITVEELQKQFNFYYQQLNQNNKIKQIDRPFTIAKFNIAVPYYLTLDKIIQIQLNQLIKQKGKLKQQFIQWILQRTQSQQFKMIKTLRFQKYDQYSRVTIKIQKKYKQLVEKITSQIKRQRNSNPTTTAYITFQSNFAKELICSLNSPQDRISKILKRLECCQSNSQFVIQYENQKYHTIIKRAPQPQDIIWANLGQSFDDMIKRKLLTYTVTLIILAISCGIIFVLSLQQRYQTQKVALSFLISLFIAVINMIMPMAIRALTVLERENTQIKFQAGIAIKSIVAQLVNSIVLPFLVNYFFQKNLYKQDGLAYDIFTMGITNAFLAPILKIFDISYLIYKIKSWYYKKSKNKLQLNQSELNQINCLDAFQIGNQYIYPVNIFLFVCFFVSLQPIVCIFGLAGLGAMYWVQKYVLFNRRRRPFPGNNLINSAMHELIYFGPLIFSLGNLTWSNLLEEGQPKHALVPNLIAACISALFALFPYRIFFAKIISDIPAQEMLYQEKKIYLPSQYDRVNPSTAKEAIKQYYQYLVEYRSKIKNISNDILLSLDAKLLSQKQRGNIEVPLIMKLLTSIQTQTDTQDGKQQMQQDNLQRQSIFDILLANSKNQKKNIVTAQTLFKQFCVKQKNTLNFIQNWLPSINKNPNQNDDKRLIKQQQKNETNNLLGNFLLNSNNNNNLEKNEPNKQIQIQQKQQAKRILITPKNKNIRVLPRIDAHKKMNGKQIDIKGRNKIVLKKQEQVGRKNKVDKKQQLPLTYNILKDILKEQSKNIVMQNKQNEEQHIKEGVFEHENSAIKLQGIQRTVKQEKVKNMDIVSQLINRGFMSAESSEQQRKQ